MKKPKVIILISFVLAFILLLGACVRPTDEKGMYNQKAIMEHPTIEEPEVVSQRLNEGEGLEHLALEVTLDDVLEIFFSQYPKENVYLSPIQLIEENNRYLYQIEGGDDASVYHLTVDATSSEIIRQETIGNNDTKEALKIEAVISPLEAMEAALIKSGSGYVEKWTLTVNQDQILYLIVIKEGQNQKIDALTGETL